MKLVSPYPVLVIIPVYKDLSFEQKNTIMSDEEEYEYEYDDDDDNMTVENVLERTVVRTVAPTGPAKKAGAKVGSLIVRVGNVERKTRATVRCTWFFVRLARRIALLCS